MGRAIPVDGVIRKMTMTMTIDHDDDNDNGKLVA